MKALRVDAPKAPPNLVNLDEPTPSDGEVIVSVAACGLNFADLLMSQGKYQEQPDFPLVPGLEVAGTVRRVGTGADPDLVGRRVAAFPGQGGLAETVNVAADRCILLPDRIDWVDAAASQVAYGTSHLALARTAQLQSGHTLLVTGAAGGVGLTAVELGKLMGSRVVGVARGPDRCAIVEQA